MRALAVVLISVMVANAIPGFDLAAPPVAPLDGPCFTVSQGTLEYEVEPVSGPSSVATFYSYSSASAHTPYVEAYASVLFLYLDTTTGVLSFVFHFNIDNGGSPSASTTADFLSIPTGAGVLVSDDPGPGNSAEFALGRNPEGQFNYFTNTDGGALGPLPSGDWTMNVTFAHGGSDPMRSQRWVDSDGTHLDLGMTGTISISSVCNHPPTASLGGPYNGFEGSPISFNAGGSSDPDGDALTYAWDFQNDGVTDLTTTSPTAPHTYPDDFVGQVRVTVSDGEASSGALAAVTAANVVPSIVLESMRPGLEGLVTVDLVVRVVEPGADQVVVTFEPGDLRDPIVVGTLWGPANETMPVSAAYGDDGGFTAKVVATDDDAGAGQLQVTANVANDAPTLTSVSGPADAEEGSPVTFTIAAADAGSDDLTIRWDFGNGDAQASTSFNDGVGPDPDLSPAGTFPFADTASFTTVYAGEGDFVLRGTIEDDDLGVTTIPDTFLHVRNVAPRITPFGPGLAVEGAIASLAATATDPGDDPLTFVWEFEFLAAFTESFPAGGVPTTATSTASFLYGDDGAFLVRLTVSDDDGASATFETTVEVANAAPTASIAQVHRPAAFLLRVAGEKWHDVRATFFADGAEIGTLAVTRTPGSPDEQSVSTGLLDLTLERRYTATVLYTPEDDPVNGQPNGANPVWIVLDNGVDEPIRVHHTFNVQHPETYEWDVDLTPYAARLAVTLEAYATDPGSDDLAFAWDFGDGSSAIATYFNDGVGPDPDRSPGGTFPFTADDATSHAFPGPGTYAVTVTVTDDDGGVATAAITLTIPG